jgi:hypothetical protein
VFAEIQELAPRRRTRNSVSTKPRRQRLRIPCKLGDISPEGIDFIWRLIRFRGVPRTAISFRWNDSADRVRFTNSTPQHGCLSGDYDGSNAALSFVNPIGRVLNNEYLAQPVQTGVCIIEIYDGLRSWGAKLIVIIAGCMLWRWLEPCCITDAKHPHRII